MNNIKTVLDKFFANHQRKMVSAPSELIDRFCTDAFDAGVPNDVISQLKEFYQITNGIPCIDGFDFHSCDDNSVFEWWSDKELWLAQRDCYTLRWVDSKFCLGDASNISLAPEAEFDSLVDLLSYALTLWHQ